MDEKQMEELNKAISKLSEEDQKQIAGGGIITNKQCKKLQPYLDVAYGGPCPHVFPKDLIIKVEPKKTEVVTPEVDAPTAEKKEEQQ